MSQANYRLILAPEVFSDRADIYAYTETTWGEVQAERYSDQLQNAFETIREDPRIGRAYPKLAPAYRFYHTGKHNIFYRVDGLEIIILRVLHESMDATQHVQ